MKDIKSVIAGSSSIKLNPKRRVVGMNSVLQGRLVYLLSDADGI
jgi:hypothetical protein